MRMVGRAVGGWELTGDELKRGDLTNGRGESSRVTGAELG